MNIGRRLIVIRMIDEIECLEAEFERVFVSHREPDKVEEVSLPCDPKPVWLPKLLVSLKLARSNGEASRLIGQGGVTLDGKRVESAESELMVGEPCEHLLRVGKRRFVRVRFVKGKGRS